MFKSLRLLPSLAEAEVTADEEIIIARYRTGRHNLIENIQRSHTVLIQLLSGPIEIQAYEKTCRKYFS